MFVWNCNEHRIRAHVQCVCVGVGVDLSGLCWCVHLLNRNEYSVCNEPVCVCRTLEKGVHFVCVSACEFVVCVQCV